MRIGIPVVLAAALAATPAMAQIELRGGDNDSARQEYQEHQNRADAHREMNEARERAEHGDYRGAAHDRAEARRDWHRAHRDQEDADRDNADRDNGGVRLQFGR